MSLPFAVLMHWPALTLLKARLTLSYHIMKQRGCLRRIVGQFMSTQPTHHLTLTVQVKSNQERVRARARTSTVSSIWVHMNSLPALQRSFIHNERIESSHQVPRSSSVKTQFTPDTQWRLMIWINVSVPPFTACHIACMSVFSQAAPLKSRVLHGEVTAIIDTRVRFASSMYENRHASTSRMSISDDPTNLRIYG